MRRVRDDNLGENEEGFFTFVQNDTGDLGGFYEVGGEEGRVAAGGDSAAEGTGDFGDGRGENGGIRDFLQALKRIVAGDLCRS